MEFTLWPHSSSIATTPGMFNDVSINMLSTSMINNTQTDDIIAHGNSLRTTLFYIRVSFLPVVLAGTITNILNFIVLSRPQMRKLGTSVFLIALAIADLGVMYFELFRVWFEWMNFVNPEKYFTSSYCKFANFTNGVFRDYSNWLIACLAGERVIKVLHPYKAKRQCTVHNARIVCFVLSLCICIPHTHCLVYSVPSKDVWWVCWEDPNMAGSRITGAMVEVIISYGVVLVVFVLNIILITVLYRTGFSCLPSVRQDGRIARHHSRRLTRTLLLIATVFLVCETPRIIVSIICRLMERTTTRRIILNLSFLLSGINHACNFFIYIFSSPRFRSLFFKTFNWKSINSPSNKKLDVMIMPCQSRFGLNKI